MLKGAVKLVDERSFHVSDHVPRFLDTVGNCDVVGPDFLGRAAHCQEDSSHVVLSSIQPIYWDASKSKYINQSHFIKDESLSHLSKSLKEGLLAPALDSPIVIFDKELKELELFASRVGSMTLFYAVADDMLFFSEFMIDLKPICQDMSVDRLGVGELVRFGGNYTERTVIRAIKKIPFGHYMTVSSEGLSEKHSFVDFSFQREEADRNEQKELALFALEQNLSLFGEQSAEILFSGGVDSSILAKLGSKMKVWDRGWYLSMGKGDPQNEFAIEGAKQAGISLKTSTLDFQIDTEEIINSYSQPTLDFSIIPTFTLGKSTTKSSNPDFLIDGTGGDAWFGFGSFTHARKWRKLYTLFGKFRGPASRYYSRNIVDGYFSYASMIVSRLPRNFNAGLTHMTCNPLSLSLLNLEKSEWDEIEKSIIDLISRLAPRNSSDDESQVILSDAACIAAVVFAGKTGQWSLRDSARTHYPFMMPNMVNLGLRMPKDQLIENGESKPMLKELAIDLGFSEKFIYRKKSGFQPPLERLLLKARENNDQIYRNLLFEKNQSGDDIWTSFGQNLHETLLSDNKQSLSIKGLYPLWSIVVLRSWLRNFQS